MDVLVACEYSARVRDAFIERGHNAWSCDLMPTEGNNKNHYQGNVLDACDWKSGGFFEFLEFKPWDLIIAHPPCTYLSASGLHWNKRRPERAMKTKKALKFVESIWKLPAKKICLENPVGCINSQLDFMPKPQYIQPYQFGEDASKKTGLWLRGLPPLQPVEFIKPRLVCKICKKVSNYDDGILKGCSECGASTSNLMQRWSNQTDSGQNKLTPSDDRWKIRSKTYLGIAKAMAQQWNN